MLEENKKNAIAFYKMAYEGNPRDAIDQFVGDKYIQHNPDVEDGKDGFIRYFERMAKEYPECGPTDRFVLRVLLIVLPVVGTDYCNSYLEKKKINLISYG